jgi:hypothetical protein
MKVYKFFFSLLLLIFADYSTRSQSITFSELNYNADSTVNSGSWVELYNHTSNSVDISGWNLKDNNDASSFIFPIGTLLDPEERLVVVADSILFSATYPSVTNYIGQISFGFSNDSDEVRLFDNTGLLQVFMEYTDSIPWPEAADGTGRTLELLDANSSPSDPANWFVGCMLGSPGVAFSTCDDALVFDEINYNSDSLLDAGDWIELYNRSLNGINLTGWSFKDSNDDNIYFFPSNTQIAAGGRLVLVYDTLKFKARHPDVSYNGSFDFNLSNDGELVRLFDFAGKIFFSLLYDDDGAWPSGADGDGYTLELLNADGDINQPVSWTDGCIEGSPGFAYDPDCNVGVQEVNSSSFEFTYTFLDDVLQLHSLGDYQKNNKISATIYNAIGQPVLRNIFQDNVKIDTRNFSSGVYIIFLQCGQLRWAEKLFIP